MKISRGLLALLLIIAAMVGAGAVVVNAVVERYTSTNAFCSFSCHSMTFMAADSHFNNSAHRRNPEGVVAGCGECHIPTDNLFLETYTRATLAMRDLFAELTHDYANPKTWEARRAALEPETRAALRRWDSSPCRSCHDASAIQPKSDAGRQSHASLGQGGVTCVDCHANLVHPPAEQAR
jgi:nitrate/TMAO reductase-like tetraheme cytochrome c subunit